MAQSLKSGQLHLLVDILAQIFDDKILPFGRVFAHVKG
jgi:hypothetical protein